MADVYLIATTGSISWATGANWSGGVAPAAGDRVFLTQGNAKIDSGLATGLTGVSKLAGLYVYDGFTGEIGTTALFGGYLVLGTTDFQYGLRANNSANPNTTAGPQWAKIDFGTDPVTGIVHSTGSPKNTGYEALLLKGTNAANLLTVQGGSVGLGNDNGATGQYGDVRLVSGVLNAYDGVTVGTAEQDAGVMVVRKAALTTFRQYGGEARLYGDEVVATAYVGGMTYFYNRNTGAASIGSLTITTTGTADPSPNPAAFTVTNPIKVQPGGKLVLAHGGQGTMQAGGDLQVDADATTPDKISVIVKRSNVRLRVSAF